MIGRVYRLMDTKRIECKQKEIVLGEGDVLVKPDFLSICAADKRYYFGKRGRDVLNKKLPMALIHEATATVIYDRSGELAYGDKVVLIPLIEYEKNGKIKENYNSENHFMSSGADGFMQDMLAVPKSGLIPVKTDYSVVYSFCELLSVAVNAIGAFEKARVTDAENIAVWGDGSMGYITALAVKCFFPKSRIFIFGKNLRKLRHFSFADKVYAENDIPENVHPDHCFECVGGKNSEAAIGRMIEMIAPQGCINLLGVSESPVSIPTRTVLDKGLTLIGSSRSSSDDMRKAAELIENDRSCRKYLKMLVSEIITVRDEADMMNAFEQSTLNDFKTVMKWEV